MSFLKDIKNFTMKRNKIVSLLSSISLNFIKIKWIFKNKRDEMRPSKSSKLRSLKIKWSSGIFISTGIKCPNQW